jgi:hypothetical protein
MVLTSCIADDKRKRAAVGVEVTPTPRPRPTTQKTTEPADPLKPGTGDTRPVPGKPIVPPARPSPTGSPANHPFVGTAFKAFDLTRSQEVAQTDLALKRAYWRVFKVEDEDAFFLWPTRWQESPFLLGVCNDSDLPRHAWYPEYKDSAYCKPGGDAKAARLSRSAALKLAKGMNDPLKFKAGAFYDAGVRKFRVFPSPHWHEVAQVCLRPLSGPLAPWCGSYTDNKAAVEAKEHAFFNTEAAASELASALNETYGAR